MVQPRLPEGFGADPNLRWPSPSLDDDPAQVAALWLHHRLLLAIRERCGHDFSAALLARESGQHVRRAQRLTSGEQRLELSDLLAWLLVYGLDLAHLLPRTVHEAFPTEYQPLSDGIVAGARRPPCFAGTIVSEPDWDSLCRTLCEFVDAELANGRAELLTNSVFRREGVLALAELGFPTSVVDAAADEDMVRWEAAAGTVECAFATALARGIRPVEALDPIVRPTLCSRRLVVTVLGLAALAQLRTHAGALTALSPGQSASLDVNEVVAAVLADEELAEPEIALLGQVRRNTATILITERKR